MLQIGLSSFGEEFGVLYLNFITVAGHKRAGLQGPHTDRTLYNSPLAAKAGGLRMSMLTATIGAARNS